MEEPKPQQTNIDVVVPADKRAALYANYINMDTSDNEITIDFIYVNRRDNPKGTLVSRVVLPIAMLEKMTDGFVQVLEVKGRKKK